MIIKKAKSSDGKSIAKLLMLAMNTLVYEFIDEVDDEKAINFLTHFVQQNSNQYSYENCLVAMEANEIVGVINCYDGADLNTLQKPILAYIHQHYNSTFTIEAETQAGEIYIDVLSISPLHQGKGIGAQLLKHVINKYCIKNNQTIGLLVDQKNPKAKRLYLGLGFEKVDDKMLCGHEMEHLQFKIAH